MYAEGKSRKFTDKSVIILKGRKYEERTVSGSDMAKRDSEKGYLACNCWINDGDFFFINQIWK